jgi:hypothetical protein
MGATMFVDHYSDHVDVYLMRDLMLSETLLAKHAYEQFLASVGVDLKAFHADNGRFADKGFRDDCASSHQTITFCGVGSHHQNGIAESVIYDDDFTMVLYLRNAAVPLHWPQLVESSACIEVYTEHQVDTWQSLPELAVDPGDFSSDSSPMLSQEVPFTDTPITMESPHNAASATRVNQVESPRDATIAARVNGVTFSDKQDNEIQSGSPVECNSLPTKWKMPDKINLDSSGLRRSACSAVLS